MALDKQADHTATRSKVETVWELLKKAAACLVLSGLATPSAVAQVPVTATWDRNNDAVTTGYRVFVGTSPGTVLAVLDAGAATSVVLPLPPGNVYYVSVRGYTALGSLGPPSTEAVVDLVTAPGVPTSAQAAVVGTTATLSWARPTSGGAALRYLVSVGTAPGASNLLSEYSVGSANSVSGSLAPGTYYARVQAGNMVGVGAPTGDLVLSVGGATGPPVGLASTVNGAAVALTWTAPDGGADSYLLEAGTASGATNVGTIAVSATSFTASAPPGTYFVRVRAVRGSRISAPSNEVIVRPR